MRTCWATVSAAALLHMSDVITQRVAESSTTRGLYRELHVSPFAALRQNLKWPELPK